MRLNHFAYLIVGITVTAFTISLVNGSPVKKDIKSYTAGHSQLAGGNGQFGVVYSLQSRWNEDILSAKYSVDPFLCYEGPLYPKAGQKLLVLAIALKNPRSVSQSFYDANQITAFDQNGASYRISTYEQQSLGDKGFGPILNPGQGVGQPELHDPVLVCGPVDANARIQKLVIDYGRLDHPTEKVLRYYMSTATKAEDGDVGDPENVIAPLPATVRDPSDPTGATALGSGNGGKPGEGVECPSNFLVYTLDAFGDAPPDFTYKGRTAPSGKKYVLATLSLKNTSLRQNYCSFGLYTDSIDLKDPDGDSYRFTDVLKKSNSDPYSGGMCDANAVITVRLLFTMPSNESATTLTASANTGRVWTWNVGTQ